MATGAARNGNRAIASLGNGRAVRIEIDPGAIGHVQEACDRLFRDVLGPAIRESAKAYCPKDTGALAESIEDHVEDHRLIVTASGDSGRDYAAYVELGHRIVAWGHPTGRQQPPRPFLRPALYQERG